MKLKAFLFLSIPALFFCCNGQNRSAEGYSTANKLKGETVSSLSKGIWYVFQDTKNNYWFGSDSNGLYRYDPSGQPGTALTHFTTKHGLPHNRIKGIQEDKYGNLYFTTLGGISKYDGNRFTTLHPDTTANNWQLQPDDLWFHTLGKDGEKGLFRYDGRKLYALTFPAYFMEEVYFSENKNKAWSPYDVYYIYKDSKGVMWFGTSNFGICRYNGTSHRWLYEDHLTNTPDGGSFGIRSILEDKQGKYWFCNTNYRYSILPDSLNPKRKDLVNYRKEKGIDEIKSITGRAIYFLSITEDNNGDLWMATYNEGIWKYDGKNVTHYPVREGGKDVTVFSIYKDRNGTLWLGTHLAGAYKFNGEAFEKFGP